MNGMANVYGKSVRGYVEENVQIVNSTVESLDHAGATCKYLSFFFSPL